MSINYMIIFPLILLLLFSLIESKSKFIPYYNLIVNLLMLVLNFFIFNMNNNFSNGGSSFLSNYNYLNLNLNKWGEFLVSMDFVSFIFMFLSNILVIICILISWNSMKFLKKEFHYCLTMTNFLLTGVFSCSDLLLFYMFFETILIPMFLVMGVWGNSKESVKASYYFFFYTLFGSLFMLMSMFKIYSISGSTSLYNLIFMSIEYQIVFFVSFFLSLAIKVPMFPVHVWLPQAHVEAPVAGSVLLAGILLKLGGYGFYSFSLPLLNNGVSYLSPFILSLSIVGMMYASMLTMKQTDIKSLMAYSSVSHMGFVTLGIFSSSFEGFAACMILMVAHGFVSSGLFMAATVMYDSFHSSMMSFFKGLLTCMPMLTSLFLMLTLANMSIPGSLNFWGEILAFKSAMSSKMGTLMTIFILTSMIFGAIYSMNLFNSLFLGQMNKQLIGGSDTLKTEGFSLIILSLLTWYTGVFSMYLSKNISISIYYIMSSI